MRFIGGKSLIIDYILQMIDDCTEDVRTVSDLFSGSGIVSKAFKARGYSTVSNDLMYFSYVILRGTIGVDKPLDFTKLGIDDPIVFFNDIEGTESQLFDENAFIYNNYSPAGGRMYFTEENAIKIDIIRSTIEKWHEQRLIGDNEHFYLLACLIEAIPYISNITGVYGAFLKHWDKRALGKLELKPLNLYENNSYSKVYNGDAVSITKDVDVDLAYFDPPYNQRQYLPNYHVLETIALYDHPNIKGVTGLREYKDKTSPFCRKREVAEALDKLVANTQSRYIMLSYNNEGLLNQEEITDILARHSKGDCVIKNIEYSRYKNAKARSNGNLEEMLYLIEKEK